MKCLLLLLLLLLYYYYYYYYSLKLLIEGQDDFEKNCFKGTLMQI